MPEAGFPYPEPTMAASDAHDFSVHPLILFDGFCGLCSRTVRFIIRRDPHALFRFAPLQSELGRSLQQQYLPGQPLTGTFILIEGNQAYTRSTAALRVAARLPGPIRHLALFRWVPRLFRDLLYRGIAASRYVLFRKRETCYVPQENDLQRFV